MTYWKESKQGWVFDRRYYVRRRGVTTVAEAERWLAHLEEKDWATLAVRQDLARRFSRNLGGKRVRCLTHHDLNAEHGFGYGQTAFRSHGRSADADRLVFEMARADALEGGEFTMPADEARLWEVQT